MLTNLLLLFSCSHIPLAQLIVICPAMVFEAAFFVAFRLMVQLLRIVALSANLYKFVCLSFPSLNGLVPLIYCVSHAFVTLGISLLCCSLSMLLQLLCFPYPNIPFHTQLGQKDCVYFCLVAHGIYLLSVFPPFGEVRLLQPQWQGLWVPSCMIISLWEVWFSGHLAD